MPSVHRNKGEQATPLMKKDQTFELFVIYQLTNQQFSPIIDTDNEHKKGFSHMVYEKIVAILCEQLMLEQDQLSMETAITDDLGADSLDLVEVLMSCEDEFDVEIPDEEAEKFKTVGDLVRYIENNQ